MRAIRHQIGMTLAFLGALCFAGVSALGAGCGKKKGGTTPARQGTSNGPVVGSGGTSTSGGAATSSGGAAAGSASEGGQARASGAAAGGAPAAAREGGQGTAARPAGGPEPRGMPRPAARGLPPAAAPKVPTLSDLRALLNARQYKQAIAAVRRVLAVHERSVSAMAIMAEAYFHLGNFPLCLAVLDVVNDQQPGHPLYLYLRGRIALKNGDLGVARKFFEEAVKKNPRLLDAWLVIGVRALQGGNYQKALAALLKAKALSGGNTYSVNLNVGSCYRAMAHQQHNTQMLLTALNYYNEADKLYRQAPGNGNRVYLKALYNKAILYLDAKVFPGLNKVQRLEHGIVLLRQYVTLAPRLAPRGWARERKAVLQILNKATNVDLPAAKAMAQAQAAQRRAAAARPAAPVRQPPARQPPPR